MYQLTSSTSIIRLIDGAVIPPDSANSDFQSYQQWLADGNAPLAYQPPTMTPEQQRAAAAQAIQDRLDALARAWDYWSIESAVTYDRDPDPQFAAEGSALRLWRSQTWAAVRQNQSAVTTLDQLLAILPPAPARPVVGPA